MDAPSLVPVQVLRNKTDQLLRLVNVHFHSCVGADELRHWKTATEIVLHELQAMQCKRAREDDRNEQRQAIARAQEQLGRAAESIEKAGKSSPASLHNVLH